MKIQDVVIPILWLAITTTVNCNLEGDVLHAQRTVWTDPNNVLQSWDPTLVNPCTWFHVTCNNDNSIIRVDLGNAGISGPLLPQLGILANLEYLELFENNLTGPIPSSFGNLSKLVSLDLYHNGLNGSIPSSLGNIKTLKFLRLNGNFLTGMVPTNVLNLVLTGSLIELDVSKNWLHGTRKTRSKSQLRGKVEKTKGEDNSHGLKEVSESLNFIKEDKSMKKEKGGRFKALTKGSCAVYGLLNGRNSSGDHHHQSPASSRVSHDDLLGERCA